MPSEKDSNNKKKSKSSDDKSDQKTSDDILASLFNDLESSGQVDDLATLINSDKLKKKKPEKRKLKEDLIDEDGPSSNKLKRRSRSKERKLDKHKSKEVARSEEALDDNKSKRRSRSKEHKSEKHKLKEKPNGDADDNNLEAKSDKNKTKKVKEEHLDNGDSKSEIKPDSKEKKVKKKKSKSEKTTKKDKSKKSKSKSKKLDKDGKSEDKAHKKKSKHSKSRSPSKRASSPSTRRRVERSRSPAKNKRSVSPLRRNRQRSITPPMYRSKWDSYRSKFDWGKGPTGHSRDNQGLMPWERDRWSRERSRSWSPTRYQQRRRSTSPKPRKLDERRIDKRELLELARKNATRLAMEGRLPKGMELGATLKNKTVSELIELCEDIQTRDLELAEPVSMVIDKDFDYDKADFSTAPVRSSGIKIKLKDGSSLKPKSNLERMIEDNSLKKHFPVSYGDSHKGQTDKMNKEWVPVEVETSVSQPEDSVMTALTKKTVRVTTAYTAYKLSDEVKVPVKDPSPPPQPPFIPEMFNPSPFVPFGMPPFPMPSFSGNFYGGYEAPEIISAAFLEAPPPPTFASFDIPVLSAESVPEPAPLYVVSNADFMSQIEELEKERIAEEALQSAINEQVPPPPETTDQTSTAFETNDWQNPGTSNSAIETNGVDMEIEQPDQPSREDEGVSSPTPPPVEFTLPEGAVLEKPVAPSSIGGLVSMRARLVIELNREPNNQQKRLQIADIDMKLSLWAKVKNETTARFGAASNMTHMVEPRPINNSIWATKDTLRNAPEFKGGIGEHLLKKMGWTHGQGLGRNMDGPVEPLTLDVKADRKGLYSTKDKLPPRREHAAVLTGNKNPVSAIMEYCAKKGIPPPLFLPTEEGSTNNRRFGCKAILNGVEYDAATGATNKKAAKAQVCLIMCQALGVQ